MIEFVNEKITHRPDVVNICSNCGEISASHFLKCPRCEHRPLTRKRIISYIYDLRESMYPALIVSKTELRNRFLPGKRVNIMTDKMLMDISNKLNEIVIKKIPDIYLRASYKVLGENTIKEAASCDDLQPQQT